MEVDFMKSIFFHILKLLLDNATSYVLELLLKILASKLINLKNTKNTDALNNIMILIIIILLKTDRLVYVLIILIVYRMF
jgi:hypothetical protein